MKIPFQGYELDLKIFETEVVGPRSKTRGTSTWILPPERVKKELKDELGRERVALKIFKKAESPLEAARWGGSCSLIEATIIQNLCAIEGISPRVYGLARAEFRGHKLWAQITDWAYDLEPRKPSRSLGDCRSKFSLKWTADMNPENWPNGWFVDFQPLRFNNFDSYREKLLQRAYHRASWGSNPRIYQDIPQWSIEGQRTTDDRIRQLRLGDIDWQGARVLDAGCNVGTMSRYASAQGASRVVGLDTVVCSRMAAEFSALFGYWNLDFYGGNWKRKAFESEFGFDVIFYLSQIQHFGFPAWAHELCDGVLFFEGHVPSHESTFRPMLEEHFDEVEYLGMARDHGPRPTFRCRK